MRVALLGIAVFVAGVGGRPACGQELGFSDRWMSDGPGPELPPIVRGQSEAGAGGSGLAAKTQNPVSDLASLPYQSNFDFETGPFDRTRFVGNLQPVVPLKVSADWNLVARVIVPTLNVPLGEEDRSDGYGDSVGQLFLTPANPGRLIWGVGPMFLFPTASESTLGFQEWGAGAAAVALISKAPIVAGALITQAASFEGSTKPFLLQPFFNFNFPGGWFVSLTGEANADWEAPSDRTWTIALGPGGGRTFVCHGQAVSLSMRFAPYLETPNNGPDWQLRVQFALLFPK